MSRPVCGFTVFAQIEPLELRILTPTRKPHTLSMAFRMTQLMQNTYRPTAVTPKTASAAMTGSRERPVGARGIDGPGCKDPHEQGADDDAHPVYAHTSRLSSYPMRDLDATNP
jgi:hypothetical protein